MKVEKEKLPKSQIKLIIEVSASQVDKFLNQALKRLAWEVKIPGFRSGKVPRFMLEQEVGTRRIHEQTLQIAIPRTYFQAISQGKITPIARPEIKVLKFAPGNPLLYEAIVSVFPEVILDDYRKKVSSLSLKPEKISVKQKDIDEALLALQKSKAEFIPTSRPAQKGDRVEIDFEATLGGIPIEKGKSQNHPLIIGDGLFVPGFEDNLVGMKKGEQKEFSIVFPRDYYKKELALKKVDFKVSIKDIQEVKLSPLDDKFAQQIGKINTILELKQDIKKRLQKEADQIQKIEFESKIIQRVVNEAQTEIPEILIEEELNSMLSELKTRLEAQGLKLEQYLKNIKKTEEDLKKEHREEAERRIKTVLVLNKIALKEKIEVEDKEVENEIDKMIKAYPKDKDKIKEKFSQEKDKQYIKNLLRNQKTIERLVELVNKK
jgi:trigger factor